MACGDQRVERGAGAGDPGRPGASVAGLQLSFLWAACVCVSVLAFSYMTVPVLVQPVTSFHPPYPFTGTICKRNTAAN